MTDPIIDSDNIEEISQEDIQSRDIKDLYLEITERCKSTNIEFTYDDFEDDPYLILHIPAGRNKIRHAIFSSSSARELLSIPFEKYTFLEPYESIVDRDAGTIEVGVRSSGLVRPARMLEELAANEGLVFESENPNLPKIFLSSPSDDLLAMARSPGVRRFSLKFHTNSPLNHDSAVAMVERFSNSIFFQIDLKIGGVLRLIRRRRRSRVRLVRRKNEDAQFHYPKYEYDSAPASLYWYARTADGMPLLQFLAYYQVVEYFFPLYSKSEAQRRIRSILKDPSFRTDRDSDIGRVIGCIREGRGSSFYDERTQLKSTINEVVSSHEARNFIESDKYLKDFYQTDYKKVHSHKIPIANEDLDLRGDISERLYGIRCKIVHTKADGKDGEVELLLPYSKEEQNLEADIDLMSFIARSCLIASGSPIS